MIRFEDVSFAYPDQGSSIHNLSFELERGDFAAVIGANGAGKSTTARLADGLLRPSSGRVLIDGEDTRNSQVSARARKVGFLFQNPDRQICKNTVREEILFGLRTVRSEEGESALQARTERILAEFSFTGDEEPFALSRGQRQRVALASIFAAEPEVLILDEPTTGLDYRECCHIMDQIRGMNEERQVTVMMVCHDMEVVLDYARKALVMAGGRLLAAGPVREVFRNRELMEKASVLPPQVISLGLRLGDGFEAADTPEAMAEAILARRKKEGARDE